MSSHRRTKIVVSLGPSTDRAKTMSALIEQGIDVARLNMSHGTRDDHRRRAQLVRDSAAQQGRAVALLVDLQGPKIRIGGFADGSVQLRNGKRFVIDTALNDRAGTEDSVGTSYTDLINDVDTGDRLLLDDGNIVLQVDKIEGTAVSTRVIVGGELSDSKGINKLGGGLSASALTEKDHEDIRFAAEIGADYLGVSFVRHGADVETARMLLRSAGSNAHVVSKIERREALDKIEEIIVASDVIMVARGDLGVEIGDAEVPGVQKRLISESRAHNTVVITATQMMQSMVSSPQPTRAEVSDVSNAVLDGTDAVMLSGETAGGKFPREAVSIMARTCVEAEAEIDFQKAYGAIHAAVRGHGETLGIVESTVSACVQAAVDAGAKAVVVLARTGATAQLFSKYKLPMPVIVVTCFDYVARQCVALIPGCQAVHTGA